jgi:hypothetical protein
MKLPTSLILLLIILSIASCSNIFSIRKNAIEAKFTDSGLYVVYSELIIKDNEVFDLNKRTNNSRALKIKILRTSSSNEKHISQSVHELDAITLPGEKYDVQTSINDGVLNVWLTNSITLETVSTISSLNTVYEKLFTLKEVTKSKVKRIKIVLKNQQPKIANIRVIKKRKLQYSWN